ncbi:recombinase family protein [Modestobacter sp. VKM Ac-2979]|uniref:recombinase family protein n=1 Tax=unclassified Modestobacter TaxID=2643866 RepID=UPI0022AB584A|nr:MULTISPECIES: recombinase family protein [unclassified Modestobacter]MCZ2811260.1 recombinase family protein [Modestobacter sp. VKM Ac-2979]MCZ2840773.1 recombinase family protein [Modestobacter sp. VKM Ac-2980]
MSYDRTGEGLGIDRQEKECRALCEEKGWEVSEDRIYRDNDISATTGKRRPAFEALLTSSPDVIVVWHLDRLLRKGGDLERVIALDVDVYPVTSAGPIDLSSPTGRMQSRMGTVIATWEGEQKAERMWLAMRQRAEQGKSWWSSRPFGFELDGTHRADEAAALVQTYADLLTGASLPTLARQLNDAGHTTCRGGKWTATTLRPVLLNARNAAIRVYDGEEIGAAAWEAIIPEDRWRAAVRLLTNPARRTGGGGAEPRNLLTGVATCGKCGGGVKVGWRAGRAGEPGAYAVYVCRASSCVSVPVLAADHAVMARLASEVDSPHNREKWQTTRKRGGEVSQALLVEQATLRSRLDAVIEDYADGLMDRGQFRTGTEKLRTLLAEVERQIEEAGQVSDLAETVSHGSEVVESFLAMDPTTPDPENAPMNVDELRTLVAAMFERVEFMPRGRGVRMLHPDHFRFTPRQPAEVTTVHG